MSSSSVQKQRSILPKQGTRSGVLMRLSSETKQAFKTTEFWAMVAIVAGILIAAWVVGQGDGHGRPNVDAFPASRAWLYVAIVGVGCMVSHGLAKAGSPRTILGQRRRSAARRSNGG